MKAMVTGGAAGIGAAVARRLAADGAAVTVVDRDGAAAAALAGEIGGTALALDLTDTAALADLSLDVDVLVNNAGVVSGKPLVELTEGDVRRTFEVNTLALYWVTQALLPAMIDRGRGHVVTIASASGLIGVARLTDYSASKWAAIGFDESLRVEMATARTGVTTTVVCPFYIDTGMFDGVKTRFDLLLPILDPDHVVAKTWAAVERGRPRVHLPPIVGALPLLRTLPVRAFDAVAGALGVNQTMDEFKGRRQPTS